MITMLFRFFALFLIISALMLLGADAVGTLESGGVVKLRSVGEILSLFAPGVIPADTGMLAPAIGLPAWAVAGGLGLVLAFFFRHQPDDDYES